jgi:CheY-like chemotaxis protein
MSMIYGFVKQSGGHIKIYSELGRGTTIKIYLPRSPLSAELAPEEPMATAVVPRGHGEKILVVEDDNAVRELSIASLQELDYRATARRDGPAALEVIRADKEIALLFTDVVLPGGMDGRQLADQARELRPGLLVLFTTGYTPNAIIHNGVLDAGVHLLPKPFTTATLGAKLGALFGSVRSPAPPSGR